jgi:hypothetical protein
MYKNIPFISFIYIILLFVSHISGFSCAEIDDDKFDLKKIYFTPWMGQSNKYYELKNSDISKIKISFHFTSPRLPYSYRISLWTLDKENDIIHYSNTFENGKIENCTQELTWNNNPKKTYKCKNESDQYFYIREEEFNPQSKTFTSYSMHNAYLQGSDYFSTYHKTTEYTDDYRIQKTEVYSTNDVNGDSSRIYFPGGNNLPGITIWYDNDGNKYITRCEYESFDKNTLESTKNCITEGPEKDRFYKNIYYRNIKADRIFHTRKHVEDDKFFITEWITDLAGKKQYVVTRDNGKESQRIEYFYNSAGRISKELWYIDGELRNSETWEYF